MLIDVPDLTIVVGSNRPDRLQAVIDQVNGQVTGRSFETVMVLEHGSSAEWPPRCTVVRKGPGGGDRGMSSKDLGLKMANGRYVAFWDDDNVYSPTSVEELMRAADGFDVGIVRTVHLGRVIPVGRDLAAGNVDTMCMCFRTAVAVRHRWDDGCGSYSDHRYLQKVLSDGPTVSFSDAVIGEHTA